MTKAEAQKLHEEHGQALRDIARTRRGELQAMYRDELAKLNVQVLIGGPRTKDELVGAILDLRYPRATLDEMNHLIYHEDSDGWSACPHCHPHTAASRCDCGLAAAQ